MTKHKQKSKLQHIQNQFHNMTTMGKGIIIILAVVLLDMYTKTAAFEYLASYDASLIEITSFFNLVERWNLGMSFSLFDTATGAKIISYLVMIVVIALLFWLVQEKKNYNIIALSLIIGGAVGNLIDRIALGAVFDFLDFHLGVHHWPAFNFADFSIVIGAFMLIMTCFNFNPHKGEGKRK